MPSLDYSLFKKGPPSQVTADCIEAVRQIKEATTFNMGEIDSSQLQRLQGLGNTRKVFIIYGSDNKEDVRAVRAAISRALMLTTGRARPGTPSAPRQEQPPFYLYVAV